jgi:hypothetical protein
LPRIGVGGAGPQWLHEIKFDGYRMHSPLDRGAVRLLTRTGLDWTYKYPALAAAVSSFRGSHVQAAQDEFGRGSKVRTSLSAGGSRIRTVGPP